MEGSALVRLMVQNGDIRSQVGTGYSVLTGRWTWNVSVRCLRRSRKRTRGVCGGEGD